MPQMPFTSDIGVVAILLQKIGESDDFVVQYTLIVS